MRSVLVHDYLPNGVEVVFKQNHFSPAVAIQCWVGVGSLDERQNERGMAHFIEHMLFKGTDRHAVGEIASKVEACGGDINAYTTFDHTVFYLTLAAPHATVGIDLLSDAIGHSRFDPIEFDREKEVILEEIRRSHDSPGARIGRRVFEMMFAGTEAGRPIIGSEASVGGFQRDDLYAFYRKWYRPRNMAVVVVGDFEMEPMRALVAEKFGALPEGPLPERALFSWRPDAAPAERFAVVRGDFQQPRLEIAFPVPPMENVDSTALDLAAFALGSGEMSRFNRRVRDGEGVVTAASASVYAPSFGGLFEMSAIPPLDRITDAVTALTKEALLLASNEPITATELARARANLYSDRIYRDERVDGQARSLGYGLRTSLKTFVDEVYMTIIEAMQESSVSGAIRRWLDPSRALIVALVPNDSPLTERDLEAALAAGVRAAQPRTRAPSAAVQRPQEAKEADILTLKNGVKLVYRHNADNRLFTLTAATEGGLRAEDAATAGLYNAMSGLLGSATRQRSYEEAMAFVEGFGASLEGFSGKDSLGFHVQCLPSQAEPMLALFREYLLQPVFPEEQWVSLKREIEQAIASQSDSPAGIGVRLFQEVLFGDHPYRFPQYGTETSVPGLDPARLLRAFTDVRDSGPWVFAATGPQPTAVVERLLLESLDGFDPAPAKRRFASEALIAGGGSGHFKIAKEREQTHIVMGYRGLTWDDPDRAALDVLVNVLGGHGGRLFKELRDKDSLAYTVSPIAAYGTHAGVVGSYIACAPPKAEKALESLREEMLKLTRTPPTAAEVDRARNHIIGSHDMSLQRSDSQTSTMALMELYGYGYDDFIQYPQAIARVTEADVMRVARRLFVASGETSVMVGP